MNHIPYNPNIVSLTFRQITFISFVASLGGLLFGFDMAVVSGVLPIFKAQYALDSFLEGWFVSSALLGCIVGVVISSYLSDKCGRRLTLLISALLFILSTLACILFVDFSHIIIGRILTGIGIGIASNVVPLYLSEISPVQDRGKLVTFYQLALTFGIVLAYVSNAYIIKSISLFTAWNIGGLFSYFFIDESWRGMFSIALIPSVIFFIGLLFIPESPSWNSQLKNHSFKRYAEVLKPAYRKAMLIGLFLPIFSQLCGINVIIYYGPTILSNLGFSLDNSLYGQIVIGIANMLFTVIAIWKVDSLGRRPLYLVGTLGGAISLFCTGILFYNEAFQSWWLLLSVICFLACFAFSIGPLKFVVVSEIFPANVRAKAMGISILAMWVSDALIGQITPYLLNNFGVHLTFFLLGLVCLSAFFFVLRNLPETKGKTFDEIQELLR